LVEKDKIMNRAQKLAWSMVITTGFAFALSCIAVAILNFKVGMPKALLGFSLVCLIGLGGISFFIFKKDKCKVVFDERDRLINERAKLGCFTAAYLFVGLACLIPFYIMDGQALISVRWLPQIFIGGLYHPLFFLLDYDSLRVWAWE